MIHSSPNIFNYVQPVCKRCEHFIPIVQFLKLMNLLMLYKFLKLTQLKIELDFTSGRHYFDIMLTNAA